MVTGFKIETDSYRESYYRSPEQWGEWREEKVYDGIRTISITENYPDVISYEDIVFGDYVFVVTVVYSSGDSFGRSTGNYEHVYVTKDAQTAHKMSEAIEHMGRNRYSFEYILPCGTKFELYTPWVGYFETVERVRVESVCVLK